MSIDDGLRPLGFAQSDEPGEVAAYHLWVGRTALQFCPARTDEVIE
jgi:hypothetical protein